MWACGLGRSSPSTAGHASWKAGFAHRVGRRVLCSSMRAAMLQPPLERFGAVWSGVERCGA
eukprot:4146184-Alexandrium_andersonii.AAC.1